MHIMKKWYQTLLLTIKFEIDRYDITSSWSFKIFFVCEKIFNGDFTFVLLNRKVYYFITIESPLCTQKVST